VRGLGADLRDLTGTTDAIRGYVTKALPNEEKPSLRLLSPEQLPAAYDFLAKEIAKLDPAVVAQFYATKKTAA
jgi:hypothetical protein